MMGPWIWPAPGASSCAQRRRYLLQQTDWPAALERHLARIDSDAPPAWYRAEHDAGRLELRAIVEASGHGEAVCYVLTRFEAGADGLGELVIVAAIATAGGHCLTAACLPLLEDLARAKGGASVRMHTKRWGLAAIAGDSGYAISEIVLRKEL